MSKTYAEKVDLNAKPSVLRINKVEAADFNDIATDIEALENQIGIYGAAYNTATKTW